MNEKIIAIYNEICQEYGQTAAEAQTIVDEAISELGLPVRSDAKLFLMVNFNQLILEPYRRAAPGFDTAGMLADDIRVILRCAQGIAQDRGRDTITSREIVDATGMTWRTVRTHLDPTPEA